jgi:hypothetical protein
MGFDPLRRFAGIKTTGVPADNSRPYPPSGVLQSLVALYIHTIADQPLPLFDVEMLPEQATKFSSAVLASFLALTVRFSTDDFFKDVRSQAVEFYKSSARDLVFKQIAEPTGSVDVLQSFCLLCLSEIFGTLPPREID